MIAKKRRRAEPQKTAYAWAVWSAQYGILEGSVRRTRGEAIRAVWNREAWDNLKRRDGWRVVKVQVTAIYFSSNKAEMQKVP